MPNLQNHVSVSSTTRPDYAETTQPYSQYEIVEANLTFHNIYNWRAEDNWLFVNLLDDPQIGVGAHYDDDMGIGNFFDGQGRLLTTWTDNPGGVPGSDLSLTFSNQGWFNWLAENAADGTFGFGFDPDCAFYNDGITLSVVTAVPEPTSILLLGFGVVVAGLACRRKK